MTGPLCFSRLDLQPFHGLVQQVENHEARALSLDGVTWKLQVLWEWASPGWGLLDAHRVQRRWLDAGQWHAEHGLRASRLPPELPAAEIREACAGLIDTLIAASTALPFSRRDTHELWLCDDEGEPLALLASADEADQIPTRPAPWRGLFEAADEGEERAEPLDAGAVAALAEQVNRHARQRRTLLLERTARGLSDSQGNRVVAPELLLRERWDDLALSATVSRYHAWHAPWLLQLPHLTPTTRGQLEQNACRRPWLVAALYRSWPTIIDEQAITAARVEARLRYGR